MSRLRVNLEKSALVLVRRVENIRELAQKFRWVICSEEAEESMEGCFFVLILGNLEEKKLEAILKCGSNEARTQNLISVYVLELGWKLHR